MSPETVTIIVVVVGAIATLGAAFLAAAAAVIAAFLGYRNRQTLGEVKVHVDGQLTETLSHVSTLEGEVRDLKLQLLASRTDGGS